ncbi:MAG TPA: phosphoribosyl-ATP diphosphatase [Candidatus Sulfotelmatobacter sp.]|nr:phosphoribosyl-ATP diphosphatase [Candidatus Sulfotelmatobacter sp.]
MNEASDGAAGAATTDSSILERLFALIESRRGGDPEQSYVARLFAKGTAKIAQKFGEEAVETVIAATQRDAKATVGESADALFHLLVLWADQGIAPAAVWHELARREGTSGIDEKKSRAKK